jgi:hypothetical protein
MIAIRGDRKNNEMAFQIQTKNIIPSIKMIVVKGQSSLAPSHPFFLLVI